MCGTTRVVAVAVLLLVPGVALAQTSELYLTTY